MMMMTLHQPINFQVKKKKLKKNCIDFFLLNIILDFIIKIEQIPNIWAINPTNGRSIKENDDTKKV
jgi:hypothetical protein